MGKNIIVRILVGAIAAYLVYWAGTALLTFIPVVLVTILAIAVFALVLFSDSITIPR